MSRAAIGRRNPDPPMVLIRLGLLYAAFYGTLALTFPFIPIYLSLRGFSPSRIGLVLAMMEGAGVVAPFLLSRLADHTGRYRTVLAAMVAASALSLFFLDRAASYGFILLFSISYGFFFRPQAGMADALSGRVLLDSTANYGKVRIWGTITFVIVSLILQATGLMVSDDPRHYITVFLTALSVLLLVVPATMAAPPHDDEESRSGIQGPVPSMPSGFYSFLFLSFIGNIGLAVHQSFGSLYYSGIVGVAGVSGLFALASVSEIPSLLFGNRILKILGHRKMFFLAMAASTLRLGILALFPAVVPIYLSQILHAFMFGFFLITGVNWMNLRVPPRRRAYGIGLYLAAGFSGANLAGSALGGFLLETKGFSTLFGVAVLFPVAAMIWILADKRIGSL